jgi:hypothetical protein
MDQLPMVPSCALEEAGLLAQYDRYRRAGEGAKVVEHTRRRLVIDIDRRVNPRLIGELVSVERECCPFFEIFWEPQGRRLIVSVSREEDEPALDAIAFALDLERRAERA